MNVSPPPLLQKTDTWSGVQTPLLQFLQECHQRFAGDDSGAVADYIPELTRANPAHFGISLVTMDGHVYEIGDTAEPFTIQSISKAFVFALALDLVGAEQVETLIGVEPSGDAFNSIRLDAQNRPFNAMVNAGAIACSGIIHSVKGADAFDFIRRSMGQFAGRDLGVDYSVFKSEQSTGDRNRAIAYLLRNSSIIKGDVEAVLDCYFQQCSVIVTARDVAIMAATLANRGLNPVTNEQVVAPYSVARTLSVMTSSGMYDYAGEWTYRVGLPAKSGVGGGIAAALPGQFGLGTFSPRLDSHGNSVRGLKVCESVSDHFDLHMLNRAGNARTCVLADYDIGKSSSRRNRRPNEQELLNTHHEKVRIIELGGALSFATIDIVSRQISAKRPPQYMIFDFRRVAGITSAAGRLLTATLQSLHKQDVITILAGIEPTSHVWDALGSSLKKDSHIRNFYLLDEAIEWAEDQIVYRYGGSVDFHQATHLDEQALLQGLTDAELDALIKIGTTQTYQTGDRIISAGDDATSLFFLQSGMVSVKLRSGVRLATLTSGMVFGEMALLENRRTADVIADTAISCHVVTLSAFDQFRMDNMRAGERIMRNLALLLVGRLIKANKKVDLLSAG